MTHVTSPHCSIKEFQVNNSITTTRATTPDDVYNDHFGGSVTQAQQNWNTKIIGMVYFSSLLFFSLLITHSLIMHSLITHPLITHSRITHSLITHTLITHSLFVCIHWVVIHWLRIQGRRLQHQGTDLANQRVLEKARRTFLINWKLKYLIKEQTFLYNFFRFYRPYDRTQCVT